jgi:hypothetical protein
MGAGRLNRRSTKALGPGDFLTRLFKSMETAIIEISCIEVWREISNYVSGEVESELKTRIELHLRNCKHCTALLEGTKNTVRLLADGDWYPLPGGFSERLFHRLTAEYCKDQF